MSAKKKFYLDYYKLESRVEALAEKALKNSVTSSGYAILPIAPAEFPVVSPVLNGIGTQERFSDLVFKFCERDVQGERIYAVLIVPRQKKNKHSLNSYAWVEQSKITGKWIVVAEPPGAKPYPLCVYNDYEKALSIARDRERLISQIPLKDWNSKSGSFIDLLDSLPEDDDEIIGYLTPEGKVELVL